MKTKQLLVAATILATVSTALAQEKLSQDEALGIAKAVGANNTQLLGTPIPTSPDLTKPVAGRDGDYGAMVLPQKGLAAEAIEKADATPVALGQLWLHQLAPMTDGAAIDREKLRLSQVWFNGEELTGAQCAIAARRSAAGKLEFAVYGKAKDPILTVPLQALDEKNIKKDAPPLDLTGKRDYDSGELTITVLGRYQANFKVTELY